MVHRRRREKVVGTFEQASLKTSLGTTKCTLSICICDVSEAELPSRYRFSRTTFSHVRQGTTVNHMCGRELPPGYVQYLFPFVSCFPPSPLLLMAFAITGSRVVLAGRKQGLLQPIVRRELAVQGKERMLLWWLCSPPPKPQPAKAGSVCSTCLPS